MQEYSKIKENKASPFSAGIRISQLVKSSLFLLDNRPNSIVQKKQRVINLTDNRPCSVIQKKQMDEVTSFQQSGTIFQKKVNTTGLPDRLKSGIENLSGHSMDDVKVHYNSSQPAQLNAHAYAKGTNIHIAPGQEKHLPHEAWHVVQQKQGRVKPTMQMKGKVNGNDDKGLEKEADLMGAKANQPLNGMLASPLQNKSINSVEQVVQGVLVDPGDAMVVTQYLNARKRQILMLLGAVSPEVLHEVGPRIQAQIRVITQNAIQGHDAVGPALQYIDNQISAGILNLVRVIRQKSVPLKHDPAFEKHQHEYLMPMMAHVQQANVLGHAMLSHRQSLVYGPRNQADAWMRDPEIALEIFRKLHSSAQGLLWFANLKQGKREEQTKDRTFKVADGLGLMNTVGRLSMMIADSDFIPHWDTRALPHNWTSDRFLEARRERPGFSLDTEAATKANLHEARRRRREADHSAATRDPETNTRTDFRYEMHLPLGKGKSTTMFNSGALRLEFSQARAILSKINPAALNEDLSYENIVAYLNHMKGHDLQYQMRNVFHHMDSASHFLQELAVLLVGIEGTQNNMMMMHGPMVMDLVSQGAITMNQGLFTGSRRPTLEAMPYFVYASDATQKGSDAKSAGPMERQTELLRTGKFSDHDLATEDRIRGSMEENRLHQTAEEERARRIAAQKRLVMAAAMVQYRAEIQGKISELGEEPSRKQIEAIERPYLINAADQARAGAEAFIATLPPLPAESAYNPSKQDERSLGYHTFRDVYMHQQFELQRIFINTFFPQVHSIDFSEGPEVKNFIDFVQRLMEHYIIYRFMGTGEKADKTHDEWGSMRSGIELFMQTHEGRRNQRQEGGLDKRQQTALQVYLAQLAGSQFFVNNCLIYAIAGAAGRVPTRQDIYTLRVQLGIGAGQNLGEMLLFNEQVVAIIMNHFGLTGTVQLYTGTVDADSVPTQTAVNGGGGIYRIHYANRHFTAI